MSSLELMKVTGCCGLTVKEIIQKCSTSAAPAPVIVSENDFSLNGERDIIV